MPAYNPERTLEVTVGEPPEAVDECVLVEDQRTGATVEVARRLGSTVEVHEADRGYGGNQKAYYARAVAAGADIVVMIHLGYQLRAWWRMTNMTLPWVRVH